MISNSRWNSKKQICHNKQNDGEQLMLLTK